MKEDPVDDFALDLGKKKKKKKRFTGLEDELANDDAENRENQETINQDSKASEDQNNAEDKKVEDGLADDLDFTLDLGKKKKKKKKFGLTSGPGEDGADDDNDPDSESANAPGTISAGTSWADSDRDYTYEELLQRVFDIIKEKNPDLIAGEKKKMVMRPPQVLRVGTKKTSFANFLEICKS